MQTPKHLFLALLLLALLPVAHVSHFTRVIKTDSPTLASIGIRSLSVEH